MTGDAELEGMSAITTWDELPSLVGSLTPGERCCILQKPVGKNLPDPTIYAPSKWPEIRRQAKATCDALFTKSPRPQLFHLVHISYIAMVVIIIFRKFYLGGVLLSPL